MPGQLTTARLPRARLRWSRAVVLVSIRHRRERAVERAYRRMVARGEVPREFAGPVDRTFPPRRF